MTGISSNLKSEIKKAIDSKNREKFKFIAAILITNAMVAALCLPMGESPITIKKQSRLLHLEHQMMTLPLNVLVTNTDDTANEIPVSLVNKDKKIIIEKAYLHELVKTEGELQQFKIEISNNDIYRISEAATDGVVAVPFVQKKSKIFLKRGSKYEVSI